MNPQPKKWRVYGWENVKYDHVGSPRFRSQAFWGSVFDSQEACQAACQRLFREEFPRFLIMYPRPASDAPPEYQQPDALQGV